jgi:type IV pilus assembly protein PilM
VVDVDVFAVQNAYEVNTLGGGRDEVVALVNLGATFTNLTMMVGGKSVFWRDMAWGSSRYSEKLTEDWGVSREAAELLKRNQASEGREPEEIQPSINAVSDAFADELTRTLDFFKSSFKVDRLDRVLLCGGGSMIHGLLEVLGERLRVSVDRFNPFQLIEVDGRTEDPVTVRELGGGAAVVVGLALRQVGDR